MSRIGKLPVVIPEKVEISLSGRTIKVKWPLWELSFDYSENVEVIKEGNELVVKPIWENSWAIWGTTRAIIRNMVIWVSEGFKKSLEISWVGYKFEAQGNKIVLSIGLSHKVDMEVPKWLKVVLDEKEKNILHISWIDKQLVWEFTAKVRAKKEPEPYKWKWIKYTGEHIRRKAGKTGASAK
jgi:large subunit ribosomal protein L6